MNFITTSSSITTLQLSMNTTNNIIETELYRKYLYNDIIDKVADKLRKYLEMKEIQHFMLRYIFNKIVERTSDNDPVFIHQPSDICLLQVEKDLEFKNIPVNPKELVEYIDKLLKDAEALLNKALNDNTIQMDKQITYQRENNTFIYDNKIYKNISNLGNFSNPDLYCYSIALNIRYSYLHLSTHGLARDYQKMGYSKYDGFEIFASSFNHYFDLYHSAFPDLEKPFGSLGSFFSCVDPSLLKCSIDTVLNSIRNNEYTEGMEKKFKECFFMSDIYTDLVTNKKDNTKNKNCYYKSSKNRYKNKVMFVNPPFDMVLMSIVFFIFEYLNIEYKTIFTVPNWSNFLFLERMKRHSRTKRTIVYPKGTLKFINHMNNKKIYPCDIAEMYLYPDL
jgi:hypothetical protein